MTTPIPNRDQLRALLEQADTTQEHAAALIAEVTHRPCSVRSIRAWLADPKLSSARPCPDWALDVLREQLKPIRKKGKR